MIRSRILTCLALSGGLALGAGIAAPTASAEPPTDSWDYAQYVNHMRELPGMAEAPTQVLFELRDVVCARRRSTTVARWTDTYPLLQARGLSPASAGPVPALATVRMCPDILGEAAQQ